MSKNQSNRRRTKRSGCANGKSSDAISKNEQRANSKYGRKSPKGDEGVYEGDRQLHSNDPAWWNKTGQFAKDSSNLSFSNAIGSKMPGFEKGVTWYSPAGIMRIDYYPSLGTVNGPADPINVAARLMYDVINAKNSRNPSYDPSDLMQYVLAVANAWSLHAWLKRAIGLMLTYAPQNRFIPDALLESMGIAPVSAENDIITWRNLANRLALKLNMLAVPKGIDYFKRAIFMNSGIYADDVSAKASLMYFNPKAFLVLKEPDETHDAAWLGYQPFNTSKSGGLLPSDVEAIIEIMTQPLFNSTDIATMSSDIIKAYGLENCFTLPAITEAEITVPEFNPEILLQINNARALPIIDEKLILNGYEVKQDMNRNCLVAFLTEQMCDTKLLSAIKTLRIPLNMPMDNPTNDDVMEATRLIYGLNNPASKIDPICTEFISNTEIWKFAYSSTDDSWTLSHRSVCPTYVFTEGNALKLMSDFSDYNKFHAAPLFQAYYVSSDNEHNNILMHKCLSDLQNYTTIGDAELRNLHEAALLSIFSPLGK